MTLFGVIVFKKEELKMLFRWAPAKPVYCPGKRRSGAEGWQFEDLGKRPSTNEVPESSSC